MSKETKQTKTPKSSMVCHDPARFECPCDECYKQLEVITNKYITLAENEKSLTRLIFLLQAALYVTIAENLIIIGFVVACWLGWV